MRNRKKKMIAPVVVTVVLCLYYLAYFGVLASLLGGVWKWIFGMAPLAFAAGIIAVCMERIKEIKEGEEDDLGQY